MLLNLASVCNTEDPAVLWGFISRYAPEATPAGDPFLDRLVGFAVRYYQAFVKPSKHYRAPSEAEPQALGDLAARPRKPIGRAAWTDRGLPYGSYPVGPL